MWTIEFYETPKGTCPTQEFLDNLNKTSELPYAEYEIDQLAKFGYKLDRPHAAPLRDKVYELRIRPQHKQFRLLYFFFYQEKIIISHGIYKKGKNVESVEIDKAIRNRTDYFARHERKNEPH
jgi:phage-related protein